MKSALVADGLGWSTRSGTPSQNTHPNERASLSHSGVPSIPGQPAKWGFGDAKSASAKHKSNCGLMVISKRMRQAPPGPLSFKEPNRKPAEALPDISVLPQTERLEAGAQR